MASRFSSDINKFIGKTRMRADVIWRRIALDMLGRIISRTPVKTGRAQGSWQVAVNAVPDGQAPEGRNGQQAVAEGNRALADAKIQDVIVILSNLSYIKPLEDGTSRQARAGMVRPTIKEFENIVIKKARRKR